MKKFITLFLSAFMTLPLFAQYNRQVRGNLVIPDLKGYVTLKCDFHIHTVFSDGVVWPTVRIDEVYKEGLDAISLTEHLEVRPYVYEKSVSHNRSYEIAKPAADAKEIILIRASEITRDMPPGHCNALFLTNSDELAKPDWRDAFRAAKAQNAFIFWNHPGWWAQQPYTTEWWPEHTELMEQGMLHGIEVAQYNTYYPEAHRWCLEKKLTMIGTSDAHESVRDEIDLYNWKNRTMTFVFAKERTAESIREALNERRTAVYADEHVIGEEKYLKELFENALEWELEKIDNVVYITFKNKSDLTFRLRKGEHDPRLIYFRYSNLSPYIIEPQGVHTISVRFLDGVTSGDVNFIIENFLVEPNTGMRYVIKI